LVRSILSLLVLNTVLFAGCGDPELEKRVADLETKVAEIEKRGPAGAAAPTANPEEDAAAGAMLGEISKAMDAMDYAAAKAKVAELKAKYPNTKAARGVVRMEEELNIIGRPEAPLTVEKWFQGSPADIEGGEATLYVFWEVWCPHCKREVPKLTETYNKYKSQGLNMVGLTKLTRDVTEDQVNAFIKEQNVAYPIAKEQGEAMSQAYGVKGIPAAAVVKGGKVVWRGHPGKLNDAMIQQWIGS
jgi:peroxiredoxin